MQLRHWVSLGLIDGMTPTPAALLRTMSWEANYRAVAAYLAGHLHRNQTDDAEFVAKIYLGSRRMDYVETLRAFVEYFQNEANSS